MDYYHMKPQEIRKLISEGKITGPTAGMSGGYPQANLVIIPKKYARFWKEEIWETAT